MVSKISTAASLAALSSAVLGQGVSLNLNRHGSTINSKSIVARDTNDNLSLKLVNQESFFSVDLSIGTPAQDVVVLLDTGSSDLWIGSSGNPFCAPNTNVSYTVPAKVKRAATTDPVNIVLTATLPDGFFGSWTTDLMPDPTSTDDTGVLATNTMDCSEYGVFDADKSSSFKKLDTPADFYISYADLTFASGIYFTDEFLINGISVPGINAALATSSNSSMGVLGVGYVENESSTYNENASLEFTYPNLPVSLKNSGAISKIAYSLFLNSKSATSGSLLFGAVDHSLYTGQLYTIPLVNIYKPEYYPLPSEFDVLVDGVGLVGWDNHDQKKTITQTPFPGVLDSGTTFIGLPAGLVDLFADSVGGVWDEDLEWYVLECPTQEQTKNAAYVFDFNGAHIYSPVKNFVYTTSDPNACVLGIFEYVSGGGGKFNNYAIIGDVVLTAMYVVYDLEEYEVSIAQANYAGVYGEPELEEIVSTVPGAIKAPNYCSTWKKWAAITGFEGTGVGMFTDDKETNPWSTTVTSPVATSTTSSATSSSNSSATLSSTSSAISTSSSNATSSAAIPTDSSATLSSTSSAISTSSSNATSSAAIPTDSTSTLSGSTIVSSSVSVVAPTGLSNSTGVVTSTVTTDSTTVVTITSCDDHTCTTSTSTALVSIATTTSSGVVTEYTTYCPLTSTVTTDSTTVVTVTSCDDNKCTTSASPALVSVATTTVSGVVTEYTTYCPLTATATKDTTTIVTITSCDDHTCTTSESPALVSVATTATSGVVTEYTTYCPLTAVTSTETPVAPVTTAAGSSVVSMMSSSSTDSAANSTVSATQNGTSSAIVTVSNDNAGIKVGFSLAGIFAVLALIF